MSIEDSIHVRKENFWYIDWWKVQRSKLFVFKWVLIQGINNIIKL